MVPATAGRSVRRATAELVKRDAVLAGLVAAHGPCPLAPLDVDGDPEAAYFSVLVRAVTYQQLAGRAASAIHGRLVVALGGTVTVAHVLSAPFDELRAAGLSNAKATTIQGLAAAVAAGTVALGGIAGHDDAEVIRQLTSVRGIGPWTAQMFLLFNLGRLDVWPVGDYGVRKGYARAWNVALPTPAQLDAAGEAWRPFRSIVAWYCWRAAETVV